LKFQGPRMVAYFSSFVSNKNKILQKILLNVNSRSDSLKIEAPTTFAVSALFYDLFGGALS
jgi:hypothetical protein